MSTLDNIERTMQIHIQILCSKIAVQKEIAQRFQNIDRIQLSIVYLYGQHCHQKVYHTLNSFHRIFQNACRNTWVVLNITVPCENISKGITVTSF